MKFWIGVENFAKIESAKICIDDYTVLVGPNNSGKTFLMQLVQGISGKLAYYLDETVKVPLLKNDYGAYKEYIIDSENISELTSCINRALAVKKEAIVREIFGKDIDVERIYVDVVLEEGTSYSITMIDVSRKNEVPDMKVFWGDVHPKLLSMLLDEEDGTVAIVNKIQKSAQMPETVYVHLTFSTDENIVLNRVFQGFMKNTSLFLPASRTGLLLLYREFFANKTDEELSFIFTGENFVESREKTANITKPMYDFLRFLQTYSEQAGGKTGYKEEIKFFEEHLIEGHISVNKQGIFSYNSANEMNAVPMYLASSMIKEITPLMLAITSGNMYNRLIIDEVEASLHPQKQLELVRFLNRLNNKGMKLIVSTHSDTFASKLSNLYILSELAKTKGEAILEQFNLEKEDLIDPERLHVYEFVMQPSGKSIVKNIPGDKKAGFQFDAFTDSVLHLYEEGVKLGEVQ